MVNAKKIKGSRFENEAVDTLNELISGANFKRVPGSGAIGTILRESSLTGDIKGEVKLFPKKFKGECKVGYSNQTTGEAKSFSLKKQWLDKIKEEAGQNFSFPLFMGKFENVRSGVKTFVVLDVKDFAYLINMITQLQKDLSNE